MPKLPFFKKDKTKFFLSDKEVEAILVNIYDNPRKISDYMYDQESVSKFSKEQIKAISVISIKHCEFLLSLTAIDKHPSCKAIKNSLNNIYQSFQSDIYYESSKLASTSQKLASKQS